MIKNILWIIGLLFTQILFSQNIDCPVQLISPELNERDVDLVPSLTFDSTIENFTIILSIESDSGKDEIFTINLNKDNPSFSPCPGLPPNKTIFVNLEYFSEAENQLIQCEIGQFTTGGTLKQPICEGAQIQMVYPKNYDENVPVNTEITWPCIPYAFSYDIQITQNVTSEKITGENLDTPNFSLPENLDFEAEYTVEITAKNGGYSETCLTWSFTTGSKVPPPGCSSLNSPKPGEIDVPLNASLTWEAVENAVGYQVFVGTSNDNFNILSGDVFNKNSTPIGKLFEKNTTYYVQIIPQNEDGITACNNPEVYEFTTSDDCSLEGPDGELISAPEFKEKDKIESPQYLCSENDEIRFEFDIEADGQRWWWKESKDGVEEPLDEFVIDKPGIFKWEIYNTDGKGNECASFQEIEVELKEPPRIEKVKIIRTDNKMDIEILVEGLGDYVYAVDDPNGEYREKNFFSNLEPTLYTIYVREKNGCGEAKAVVNPFDFPKFFTPNGDETNDTWGQSENEFISEIYIYDRQGKLLKVLHQGKPNWDGKYGASDMPESDYWFRAITSDGKVITGHFALLR